MVHWPRGAEPGLLAFHPRGPTRTSLDLPAWQPKTFSSCDKEEGSKHLPKSHPRVRMAPRRDRVPGCGISVRSWGAVTREGGTVPCSALDPQGKVPRKTTVHQRSQRRPPPDPLLSPQDFICPTGMLPALGSPTVNFSRTRRAEKRVHRTSVPVS